MMTDEKNASWRDPGPSWQQLQGHHEEGDFAPPNDWAELVLRRRNVLRALMFWLGVIPFFFVVVLSGMGVVMLLGSDVRAAVDMVVFGLLAAYMLTAHGSLIVAWHRLRTWRCPECDRAFFNDSPLASWPLAATCAHCQAKLPRRPVY
ncbi:MAG: hypothetical protein RIC55_32750 [Pirellulaceae bacterium]